MRRVFILRNDEITRHCCAEIGRLSPGEQNLYRVLIESYDDDQKREQQEKYHAMMNDIARHMRKQGSAYDNESWKRLLIEAFVHVMREEATATGKPDPFRGKGQIVPSLDGKRLIQLGVQSRGFGKKIACDFIEYLYAYGEENGVTWTEPRRAA